jgi:putative spermidine/putrescine transport system substrate-binding protein
MKHDADAETAALRLRELLLETQRCDRRAFVSRLLQTAAGSSLLSLVAERSLGAASGVVLTTMGYGGEWDQRIGESYYRPYTARSGTAIRTIPYDAAKVLAMHQARSMALDFIDGGGLDTPRFIDKGTADPIDWSIVDKSALTPNQLRYGDYAIGSSTLSYVMVYSKLKWPGADHPKSWRDFWDVQRFPGARAFGKYTAYPSIEFALLADGVPMDKLYPLDLDRAFKSLDRIKPHIGTWWDTAGQQQQLMEDREVDLMYVWNGRGLVTIRDRHAPYQFMWNEAAYQGEVEAWMCMKGRPHAHEGMQIMNWLGRPEPQAAFARLMYYGPTNLKAYQLLDPEFGRLLPSHPDNLKVQFHIDWGWWAKNYDATQKRFAEWLQA